MAKLSQLSSFWYIIQLHRSCIRSGGAINPFRSEFSSEGTVRPLRLVIIIQPGNCQGLYPFLVESFHLLFSFPKSRGFLVLPGLRGALGRSGSTVMSSEVVIHLLKATYMALRKNFLIAVNNIRIFIEMCRSELKSGRHLMREHLTSWIDQGSSRVPISSRISQDSGHPLRAESLSLLFSTQT